MTDEQIEAAYPRRLAEAVSVNYGPFRQTYPAGTTFYTSDFILVRTIQQNLGRRPIAWSSAARARCRPAASSAACWRRRR